jgi:hypothetical protein
MASNAIAAYINIRQHTSAYVSIRQHTSAYVSILEIVLALGSCLGGFSAFSRLHVCVCGESRAEL